MPMGGLGQPGTGPELTPISVWATDPHFRRKCSTQAIFPSSFPLVFTPDPHQSTPPWPHEWSHKASKCAEVSGFCFPIGC